MRIFIFLHFLLGIILLLGHSELEAQHEFYIDHADVTVEHGAGLYIDGDLHLNGGNLTAQGNLEIRGDWHLDDQTSQLLGNGTVIFKNASKSPKSAQRILCNKGEMTGQRAFYNLELENNAISPSGLVALEGGNVEVTNRLSFGNATRLRTSPNSGGRDGENLVDYPHYIHVTNPSPNAISNVGIPGDPGRFFEGRLRRTVSMGNTYDFPVGIDPGTVVGNGNQLIKVAVTGGTGVVEGSFTRSNAGPQPSIAQCNGAINCKINHGYWNLDLITGNVTSYNLVASAANARNLCQAATGEYVILYRPNSTPGTPFVYMPNEANICGGPNWSANPASVPRSGFTSFSDFAIGRFQSPLPISLVDLRAYPNKDHIKVEWVTSDEINSSHFDLERSTDGMLFEKISTQQGAGNSSSPILYEYEDYKLAYNLSYYYRLKIHDLDGNFSHSDIVESKLPKGLEESISIFPNPAKDLISVKIFALQEGAYSIIIHNIFGKEVMSEKGSVEPGPNTISLDLGAVAAGHYLIKAKSEQSERIEKLVISK